MTVDTANSDSAPADSGAADTMRAALEAAYGGGGVGVLVGLAALGAGAQLVTRGLAPALPGVWVGMEASINGLKLLAAVMAQLFAVGAVAALIFLVMSTVRSDPPSPVRAFAVGAGVLTVLAVMIASAVRLPSVSRIVLAASATALASMSVRVSVRSPTTRAAALVCGVVATAGMFRLTTVVLSTLATNRISMGLAMAARVSATICTALVTMGVVASLVWLARVGRPGRWSWLGPALVVVLAAVVTGVVFIGMDPEAGGVPLWLYRSLDQLAARPLPFGPLLPLIGLEALRWLAAAGALSARPKNRAMGACVALALVSGGTLEIPSCAISLVVATLALALHPRVPTHAERRALLQR